MNSRPRETMRAQRCGSEFIRTAVALVHRERWKVDGDPCLSMQQAYEGRAELGPVPGIAPDAGLAAEVKAAGFRGGPQLAARHVAVDDELAAGAAIDRQHSVV